MKSRLNLQPQQTEAALNPWLLSYIRQQQNQYTRFEIDHYLLDEGANPVEIEAVWEYLAASLTNQKKPKITKRWSYSTSLGWFIYSLIHIPLILAITEVWPVYGIHLFLAIPAGIVCLTTLISLLIYNFKRKANVSKKGSTLLLSLSTILLIICTVAYAFLSLFIGFDDLRTDFGTVEANGHTYRAVLQTNIFADSPYHINLYKCEIFNLVCPLLEGETFYSLYFDIGESHLAYNSSINKIQIWSKDKGIYTFKKI